MNEENKLDINFSFTDEFGQLSNLHKTFNQCVLEENDTLPLLVDQFKVFLIGAGFLRDTVDKIQLEDN